MNEPLILINTHLNRTYKRKIEKDYCFVYVKSRSRLQIMHPTYQQYSELIKCGRKYAMGEYYLYNVVLLINLQSFSVCDCPGSHFL